MSDHEQTLLQEAKRFGLLAERFIRAAPRDGQARRAERDTAVQALRDAEKLLIQIVEKQRAACLSGADALVLLRELEPACYNAASWSAWKARVATLLAGATREAE